MEVDLNVISGGQKAVAICTAEHDTMKKGLWRVISTNTSRLSTLINIGLDTKIMLLSLVLVILNA